MVLSVIKIIWNLLVLLVIFLLVMAKVRKKPDSDTILINQQMSSFAMYVLIIPFALMFIFQLILWLMKLAG